MPDKVSQLRREFGQKAEQEPKCRFYTLHDRIFRTDVLEAALARVRGNDGAPGIDGVTFERIEQQEGGASGWLRGLRKELQTERCGPQTVRRVYLLKANGKQ